MGISFSSLSLDSLTLFSKFQKLISFGFVMGCCISFYFQVCFDGEITILLELFELCEVELSCCCFCFLCILNFLLIFHVGYADSH